MKRVLILAATGLILAGGGPGVALAQDYPHDNGRHEGWDRGHAQGWRDEWRPGHRMDRDYWARAERVDWRRHHLRRPPRGYEWRYVDGRYVLAAAATGLIASIIANSR